MNALKLVKNKAFLSIWLSEILTYLGDAVIQIALIAWLMSFADKMGTNMAMIMFFFMLPSFLFSPVAGILADKLSRKAIMISVNVFKLLSVGLMMYFVLIAKGIGAESIAFISFTIAFLTGTGAAFFYPAFKSTIPNIVKPYQIQSANSLTSCTISLAILFGGILSGFYIKSFGLTNCIALICSIYIISAIILIPFSFKQKIIKTNNGFINNFSMGINYLKNHKHARRLVILSIVLSFITATFFNVLNAVAIDFYNIGIEGLSRLKLQLGVGMIAGSLIALYINKYTKTSYLLAGAFGLFVFTTATACFANTYEKALFWLMAVGIANALIIITIDTLLQKVTPDKIRGKIFGVRSSVGTLVFIGATYIISQFINKVNPFDLFRYVALASALASILIMLFDKQFAHFVLRTIINSTFKTFYPVKVEGLENIPKKGKVILAGNHTGWFDSFILTVACARPIWFFTGTFAFTIPVIKYIINYLNVIPVVPPKGKEALEKAVTCLNKGNILCIFPEGRLTSDGSINRFRKGVSYLHKESKAPIVPFAISGGFEAWSWGQKLPKLSKISIQFAQQLNMQDADDSKITTELQSRVQFVKNALERVKINGYDADNVLSLMQMKGDINAAVKALSLKEKNGEWQELSYIELSRLAKKLGNYLIEAGYQREDRIAILSESRPEWGIAFFASIQTGAVTVPLDIKLTLSELISILSDCRPRVLCVSNSYLDKAIELKNNIDSIEKIIIIEESSKDASIPAISELKASDKDMGRERDLEETALIVYTSGTTGNPKGVMISFKNIIAQLRDFEKLFNISSNDSLLSILPLNHLLELNVGFLGMLHMGAQISYTKSLSPKEITKAMKERKVTYMIAVPLFVKMIKGSIEKEINKTPKSTQNIFNFLYNLAAYIPCRKIKKLLFKKIHDNFGGNMKGFVCGGAPLDKDVAEFFDRIGLPVYQGYGLTETSPTLTTNYPNNNKIGSVGKVLPGVTIKIADNGEILATGPNLMKGYYGKPEMTAEVIDENGWFHTGDIGELDSEGYLYITGRIKNMIVLAGGKKIFPEEVEAVLEKSDKIKEVCVMALKIKSGNKAGTEEVGAIIVPADELSEKTDQELKKILEDEAKDLGNHLAAYKQPTVIVAHRNELPKTATRKVKRKPLLEWYEALDITTV